MRRSLTGFDRTYQFIASKKLAMLLFALIGISLVPGTFAAEGFHLNPLSRIFIGALGLNLVLCTAQRIRTLRRPVLMIHVGIVVVIAGMVLSAFGSIATVNIYEGMATDTVYRWDQGRDAVLGYALEVRKINKTYYPVAVRVGVLRGQVKQGLHELKTGDAFALDGYTIRADTLDPDAEDLQLSILRYGQQVGRADTSGTVDAPKGFPFAFKLVAYKNPVLKRAWVDLRISRAGQVLAAGTSEVNAPLVWNGRRFFCTSIDRDPRGRPFAGIQIVRAPETPVVYAGFFILSGGCLYWMYGKLSPRKRQVVL